MAPLDELRCDEEDCDVISTTKAQKKRHSLSHSKDKVTCGDCGKDFVGERSLRVHEGRIHKKKNVDSAESAPAPNPLVEVGMGEDISHQVPTVPSVPPVQLKNIKAKRNVKDATPSKPKPTTPKLKKGKRKSAKLVVTDVNGKTKTEKAVSGSEDQSLPPEREERWSIPCHCPQCRPCSHVCCENPAVRAGQCCDPRTLGRCLQPYQVNIAGPEMFTFTKFPFLPAPVFCPLLRGRRLPG